MDQLIGRLDSLKASLCNPPLPADLQASANQWLDEMKNNFMLLRDEMKSVVAHGKPDQMRFFSNEYHVHDAEEHGSWLGNRNLTPGGAAAFAASTPEAFNPNKVELQNRPSGTDVYLDYPSDPDSSKSRTKFHEHITQHSYEIEVNELPEELSDRKLLALFLTDPRNNFKLHERDAQTLTRGARIDEARLLALIDKLPPTLNAGQVKFFLETQISIPWTRDDSVVNNFFQYMHQNRSGNCTLTEKNGNKIVVEIPKNQIFEEAARVLSTYLAHCNEKIVVKGKSYNPDFMLAIRILIELQANVDPSIKDKIIFPQAILKIKISDSQINAARSLGHDKLLAAFNAPKEAVRKTSTLNQAIEEARTDPHAAYDPAPYMRRGR
jgi:hypothetical protein